MSPPARSAVEGAHLQILVVDAVAEDLVDLPQLVVDCLRQVAAKVQFDPVTGKAPVIVRLPLVFTVKE